MVAVVALQPSRRLSEQRSSLGANGPGGGNRQPSAAGACFGRPAAAAILPVVVCSADSAAGDELPNLIEILPFFGFSIRLMQMCT